MNFLLNKYCKLEIIELADEKIPQTCSITDENKDDISDVAIGTILAAGDVAGSVCLVGTKGHVEFGEIEKKLIQTATGFIGKQLEL